jgi:hypothetical protein
VRPRAASSASSGDAQGAVVPCATVTVVNRGTSLRRSIRFPIRFPEERRAFEIDTLTETVMVATAARLLQTDKAHVSTELRSAEFTAIPPPTRRWVNPYPGGRR